MENIRITCPNPACWDDYYYLTAEEIYLEALPREGGGSYTFKCPRCLKMYTKPANHRVVLVLKNSGVYCKEPDPLTKGEVEDFAKQINKVPDAWYAELGI